MGVLILATCLIALLAVLNYFTALYRNYKYARKSGLRCLISPLTPYTWHWQVASVLFGPLLARFRWFRAIDWTCAWHDDDALHRELGLCFVVVSPGYNVLCTSDAKTTDYVLKKWRDFVKPDNVNEILSTFGQNVDTSNGDDWIRHRKLTAPCFSERASTVVWGEALQQSEALLAKWLASPTGRTSSMIKDTSTLALNVISSVAFENHEVNKPAAGHTLSLRDSLVTVMSTSISPALEGIMPWLKWSGLQFLLPAQVENVQLAMREFRQYMDETVIRERKKTTSSEDTKIPNLISTLIRANDAAKSEDVQSKARLSDSELRGNIFVFTIGGLESTAITLSYTLAQLAVNPDIQNWVCEELTQAFGAEDVEYTRVFPKLKRVMAIMYETLRLYGPSPPIPRAPKSPNLEIPITSPNKTSKNNATADHTNSTSTFTLPPNTQIMLNSWASHTSAQHFPKPKTWDPKRWIAPGASLAEEKLLHPTFDSGFYAWGAGPRICPGMKFSQVEYTAVLASVLKRVRVGLAGEGADEQEAREKVLSVLKDSCAEPLLLHVRKPEELWVRFEER